MGTVRIFKHHVHSYYVMLAGVETILLFLAFYLAYALANYMPFEQTSSALVETASTARAFVGSLSPLAIGFALLTVVWMAAMGLYQPQLREGSAGIVRRTLGAFLFMIAIMSGIFWITPGMFHWWEVFTQAVALAFVFVLCGRWVFSRVVDGEQLKRNVLVYGAGETAAKITGSMRRKSDRRGFRFAGFVQLDDREPTVENQVVKLDGGLADYVERNNIQQVVIAVDDRRGGLPVQDLLDCKLRGVEVIEAANFFEREAGKIMLDFVTPGWLLFSEGFKVNAVSSFFKRAFDLLASFLLLMVTWPVMLLTVLAIWLEDGFGAPVVYRQKRVGLNGQIFEVLKFRSMVVDAERLGKPQWASKGDSRITRVGNFIRRSRIDELPQIINVLAGDMAFIGPRPERPEFVQELCEAIPHYNSRHYVKPGITGWAQLCYPYGSGAKDAAQKLQFDLYYVKNHSLFLDFLIMITTVEVVLFGKGAR
jgi:sugar transferase (PEP-CTERM system associated)